jgi:hypothetical protein
MVIFCAASTRAQRRAGEPWREMCPMRGLPSQAADSRRQSRPGAQMPRGRKARDVTDLGDQHRGIAPNATDLGKHVDAVISLGALVDLAGRLLDLAVKVADQRHQAVQATGAAPGTAAGRRETRGRPCQTGRSALARCRAWRERARAVAADDLPRCGGRRTWFSGRIRITRAAARAVARGNVRDAIKKYGRDDSDRPLRAWGAEYRRGRRGITG